MKTNKLKILLFILTVCLSAAAVLRAQTLDGSPVTIDKISPNATQISGVFDAQFSPSGKSLIIQSDGGFYLLPSERLDEIISDFANSRYPFWKGWAQTFLPSEKVVYAPQRGLYTLDAQTGKTQPIYQINANADKVDDYLSNSEMVVVSENLIISGDGDYDIGGDRGNILRFDLRRGRVTRSAQIDGFKKPRLSPSKKYVLYEHGNDDTNHADLYDIARNINYPIPKRFDFKRRFPKYKYINVNPLIWVAPDKFVATVDENQSEEFKASSHPLDIPDTPAWLALFDAATGKIVWKKQLSFDAPGFLDLLNASKAFFYNENGRYEVSLADGRLTKLPDIEGEYSEISPDKKRVAILNGKRIYVSSLDGKDKTSILELPENWWLSLRAINWSPDGKRLLVSDQNRLLIIKVEAQK